MIFKKLLSVFFLLPAFFDILLISLFLINFLFEHLAIPIPALLFHLDLALILLFIFPISIGVSVFALLYHLIVLSKRKNRVFSFILSIYNQHKHYIALSLLLYSSTVFSLYVPMLLPPLYIPVDVSGLPAVFILKALCLLAWFVFVRYIPFTKIIRLFTIGLLTIVVISSSIFFYSFLQEFIPHVYFAFPLDDPKGEYVINYDGDYWVTYYTVKYDCASDPAHCKKILTKSGNTSVTETPVDLKDYIDRPVRIEGEFVAINGSLDRENKTICLREGWKTTCKKSLGPGYWYASPLKITAIRFE